MAQYLQLYPEGVAALSASAVLKGSGTVRLTWEGGEVAGVVLQLESVHHVQQNEPMTGGLRSSSPSAPQRQAPQMATKIQPYLRLRDGEVRELMQAGRKPVWLGRWASHPCAHPTRTEAPAGLCPGGVEGRGREPGPLRTPGFGEKRRGCAYGRGTGKGDPQRDSAMLERARRYGGATLEGAGPRGEGGSSAPCTAPPLPLLVV